MDGVSSSKNNRVLVVACSNRLEAIDSALLRSGRLEEHLYLGPPSPFDLADILKLQTRRMPLDARLSLDAIAEQLFELNATPADVEGLCRDVCFIAFRRLQDPEQTVITPEDFENALQVYSKI
jgi:transitional endoplasmic reticulum ATPase